MRFLLSFLIFLFTVFIVNAQYDFNNVNLLSVWKNPAEPNTTAAGNSYSGVWGWHDTVKNKNYAIIGSSTGTYFIDVTDPYNPVQRDFVAGASGPCTWRELKSYSHYAYIVSDVCTPNTFQIIDMQYLPDSVHVVKNDANLFSRAHAIYIDNNKLYVSSAKDGIFGSTPALFASFSLADPESPQLIRNANQDFSNITYVHDMFARNDTIFASAANQGLYEIIYYNNQFQIIGILSQYPNAKYNHSSWLTDDSRHLVMCEETKKTTVKIVDVSDPSNLFITGSFISDPDTGAIHHNPFVVGNNKAVVACYKNGVQIFDFTNPSNPVKTGFFDTYPQNGNDYSGYEYQGCWGAYPYLPGGIILASDMENGLFILDGSHALGISKKEEKDYGFTIYPNPARESTELINNVPQNAPFSYKIMDICGRLVLSKAGITNNKEIIDLSIFNSGAYFLEVRIENKIEILKLIKQ